VLIYEHLDESLVLMKRRLCWQLDDILYLKFHHTSENNWNNNNTSKELRKNLRKWNQADVELYEFFNASLWTEIGYEGKEFWSDLQEFKDVQKNIEIDCLRKNNKNKRKFFLHEIIKENGDRSERKANIFLKLFNIRIDLSSGGSENKIKRPKRNRFRRLLNKGRLLTDEDEIRNDFYSSGESPEKEETGINNNEVKLNSQVSKWNEHFCKKLLQNEQDYLSYFRKKHAYAKSLLKLHSISN